MDFNNSEIFTPVVTKRASEIIYDQVKALIIKGDLKPGDRLPSERNMMEKFQRSRPTIREALRMLERSGYIRTIPGSNGAIVMLPGEKNMEQTMEEALNIGQISLPDLTEYRRVSENATVCWAVERASDEDIRKLEELLDTTRGVMEDYVTFVELDTQFHGLLANASRNHVSILMNRTFAKLIRGLMLDKMSALSSDQRLDMCRRVQKMHEDILKGVKARDIPAAKKAMETHILAFGEDLN